TFYDSVAREMGMPAEFLMGFPIPRTKHSGSVGGYHCWTQVYVPNRGWMPMDISEADKHSDLVDYYYGTLDADRVTMTMGKNIRLSSGKRVNYLVYPEVNDEDRTTVSYSFSFTNIPL
ncbi:MAG: transglutaminase-like domain-containing protein, partial [bacterium]